ncbi:protein adenylyltransferase SelO [Colwellia sp. 12G3]|uniref:protein adenylyltransferase SelO n=1 Tax=Colwellia sp. 12G3 TaxID=2058299 RepID=UPI000C3319A0|nr:YdiU family protein [Colwellia sp. 12G3]PKI12881.1 YdiU family protein [Colwellia sp. 12G3]
MTINLSNNYRDLGESFSQKIMPDPVAQPSLLLWNAPLAQVLGLTFEQNKDADLLAQYFSGNQLLAGSEPIAQAYSGHQFGQFNPQLGDGRAHLLGDVADADGQRWDIQLKGSGVSQFSRQGDGRCALGPALREYIMSEAMFALGVPTTRCLAVVTTGQSVYRDRPFAGAIVTRVAASHIRVGTFQYFAARGDTDSLKKLINYSINRHFPELLVELGADTSKGADDNEISSQQVLNFFSAVLSKQIPLVLSWLRVGFIHGVMNTDNTTISGETIDYGPCAMMNTYHAETVFSSIDRNSRYAFGKQISIMQWNMTRLAETLLPLVDSDEDDAVAQLQPLLAQFHQEFEQGYLIMMAAKIGINEPEEGDGKLISELIAIMQKNSLDYTQTFTALTASLVDSLNDDSIEESSFTVLSEWLPDWQKRIAGFKTAAHKLMLSNNPVVIPRNHDVEAILATSQASYQEKGDLTALHEFLAVLRQPYTTVENTKNYQNSPADGDENYHTFCGT